MSRADLASRFEAALADDRFVRTEINSHVWHLVSPDCVVELLFERYEPEYHVELRDPRAPGSEPLNLLLLRHLRGARLAGPGDESPEHHGALLATYFPDLLAGDFAIRARYEAVYDVFYRKLFDLQMLPEDHPAWARVRRFDLGWMDEL